MTDGGQRSIVYQPALDGVRGVAVIVVLLFHLGLSWMSGGYLGVSVFFTLSGFLITTLLVRELQRSGGIRLGRFYGRRARRLLPASIVCLIGAIIVIKAELVPDRSGLRWYVFGGLFQFANWVPLALRNSYSELFHALSPTDHFWSLAIEEQFYWLWPVSMLGLYRLIGARSRAEGDWLKRLVVVLGALYVVFAISAPLTAQLWNNDAAYFATWARIPEILAGAVLAVVLIGRALPAWVRHAAPVGLLAIVALSVATPAGHGFAYDGGLPLFALISAGLIAGLQHPSPTSSLMSFGPLVFVGRISYGLYLFHWPVFVVLTHARTGLSTAPLAFVRLGVTVAIALASFYGIEQPIRQRRVLVRPRLALSAVGIMVPIVVILGFSQVSNSSSLEQTKATLPPIDDEITPLVTSPVATTVAAMPTTTAAVDPTSSTIDQSTIDHITIDQITTDQITTEPATVSSAASVPAPTTSPAATTVPAPITTAALVPSRPVRILIVGDSTAQATATGLIDWSKAHPDLAVVETESFGGCGIVTEGDRLFKGAWIPASDGCTQLFDTTVPKRIVDGKPDIVVVISSFWEVTDRRLDADSTVTSIIDPAWRQRTLDRFTAYAKLLLDSGTPRVAYLLYPSTDYGWGDADEPADDPQRYVIFHEIEREAAAPYPGQVSIIDEQAWSDAAGLTTDQAARPDGVHWTEDESTTIAEQWLGNQLIQAALH